MKLASVSVSFFCHYGLCHLKYYLSTSIATYSVQKLVTTPSNETTAAAVQCFFAVNAPAHGCFLIFSNTSFTFNQTIIRSDNALKAKKDVTISDTLPSNISYMLFDVAAYDYYINQTVNLSKPAVVLLQEVLLSINPALSTTSLKITEAISMTSTCMFMFSSL